MSDSSILLSAEAAKAIELSVQTFSPGWALPGGGGSLCPYRVIPKGRVGHCALIIAKTPGGYRLAAGAPVDRWAEFFNFDIHALRFRRYLGSYYTKDRRGRLTWNPDGNSSRPWMSVWCGSCGATFASIADAQAYFREKRKTSFIIQDAKGAP